MLPGKCGTLLALLTPIYMGSGTSEEEEEDVVMVMVVVIHVKEMKEQ